jgi:NAD(P)-dependent dehydrogenase (short-subunit alcohol dehydrogenase family)
MDKIVVITGATSGIGYQTALQLAHKKHRLILVCRNKEKADLTRNRILDLVPAASIDLIHADLSVQQQIRKAGMEIIQLTNKLDVLVNNAGTWNSQRKITEDGVEEVFAVNHLSYFLITHLLYPLLALSENARIINLSSDSHFKGKMHFDDLGLKHNYHGLRSYAQSKLANVLFTYELDRLKPHQNIVVNAVQPGLVKTDIGLKNTKWWHALAWKIRRSAGVSSQQGAQTSVYLATSKEVATNSAKYWDNCRSKPSSKDSYDPDHARKLWEISARLCSVDKYFAI